MRVSFFHCPPTDRQPHQRGGRGYLLPNLYPVNRWAYARFIPIFLFLLVFGQVAKAQSLLNLRVNINVQNTSIAEVLKNIEQQGDFFFAYNPNNINETRTVSLSARDKKVGDVLNELFQNRVALRQVEKHIIISEISKSNTKNTFRISGRIADGSDFPLDSVIVYDPENEQLEISRGDGSFEFDFNTAYKNIGLFVSRPSYNDTVIYVGPGQQEINLRLYKELSPFAMIPKGTEDAELKLKERDFESLSLVQKFVPPEAIYASRLNTEKIMPVQLSFLPKMGTNSFVRGLRVNNASFNLLAGYSKGLKGAEFGGIANIIQKEARGVQAAGIANIVLGDVRGVQFSGLYTNDFSNVNGFQVSGLHNTLQGELSGGQISGFSNIAPKNVKGIQIGGILNVAKGKVNGAQVSGGVNISYKETHGAQIACMANISKKTARGLQLAGIYNRSPEINGLQLSCIVNQNRKKTNGVQISSILNKTKTLKGLQIGLVNIADTISSGFQIGLINIVKNGTYSFELSYNETYPFELYFKIGNPKFNSIINLAAGNKMFGIGYGLGYNFLISNKFVLYTDVVASSVNNQKMIYQGEKLTMRLALDYELFKHFSLKGGVSGNCFFPDKSAEGISSLGEHHINRAIQDGKSKFWAGWFLGIQISDVF